MANVNLKCKPTVRHDIRTPSGVRGIEVILTVSVQERPSAKEKKRGGGARM